MPNSFSNRYSQILTELLQKLLLKVQFRFNENQLEEMDDETLENDVSSTLTYFILDFV